MGEPWWVTQWFSRQPFSGTSAVLLQASSVNLLSIVRSLKISGSECLQHTSRHQLPVCMCIRFRGFLESLPVHGLPGRGGSECRAQSMHEMRWWKGLWEATSNIFGSLGVSNHDFFKFLYVMLRGNVGIFQTVRLCISTYLIVISPRMF